MKVKELLYLFVLLGISLASCTKTEQSQTETEPKETVTHTETALAQNMVSIIEIPAADLTRAIAFYKAILSVEIEEMDMGEVKMGILPAGAGTVNVVLASGADYKPSADGSVLYLNGGDNLQSILDKIEPAGGKVLVPKTEISPEMGFFALFTDSEGNKMGLHSAK